jgi:hypothetical protein
MCKFWKWAQKSDPAFNGYHIKPALSIMHAKAPNWSCQVVYTQAVEMIGGGGMVEYNNIDMCTIKWTKNYRASITVKFKYINHTIIVLGCAKFCQAVKNYILSRNLT